MKKNKNILIITLLIILVFWGVTGFYKFKDINIVEKASYILGEPTSEISEDWRLILVNNSNSLPKDYEVELTQLSNGICIDSRIYPDLQQMFDDARSDGIYPIIGEGYRTHEEQQNMMQDKIDGFIAEG